MSLINREDLMQTLGITDMDCEKCGWYSRTARRCKRGSDFEDACCAINDALEVEPEQRWIPCSERLPEEEGEYLITDDSGGIKTIEVDSFMFFEDETKDWCYSQNTIAWMPLPEPWNGE